MSRGLRGFRKKRLARRKDLQNQNRKEMKALKGVMSSH